MARGKIKIERIENEKVLKSTFQKLKKGLIKKVKELTTLCDIIACVIIYSPVIGGRPPEIFTWPEEQDRVHAVIKMYKEKINHSKRTADLCNYLKDKRRLESDMSDDYKLHIALSGGGVYERPGMSVEVAMEYLKWVDARIKAVEERIDLVKNAGGMMLGDDQCQNVMYGDQMMFVPVNQMDYIRNFGHGLCQNWPFEQNPFAEPVQFDFDVYDQTLCGYSGYNPICMNSVPDVIQFQQPVEPKAITFYQQNQDLSQNEMCLYDPYLLGMEQSMSNTMADWNQHCHQQQHQYGDNMQYLSNAEKDQAQPSMSSRMDDRLHILPYVEDWSSPDAASSNYSSAASNQFYNEIWDDPLDYFLNTSEFDDDTKPLGDAPERTIPS